MRSKPLHRKAVRSSAVRRKGGILLALVVAVGGSVGGAYAHSAGTNTVTLSVDGRVEQIDVAGSTVADVLADQEIEVGPHDAVAPTLDSPVDDGSRIAVRFGRALDLTVDGEEQRYWVTATSVNEALLQIGHRFAGADLSASRTAPVGRAGLDLSVRTEKTIRLVAAGRKQRRRTTTALTVGGALRDLGVRYDGNDEVRPAVDAAVEDGARIRLVRISHRTRKVRVSLRNETVVRYDDSLAEGRERVRRKGREGVRVDTYRVVLADGERRSRRLVDRTVSKKPADRVEVHGTKEPESAEGGLSGAPCPSGSDVEEGLTSNAVAVHRAVCAEFPQVSSYGGLRVGDDGEHGEGRALDIMVSDSSLGDAIAEWVRSHHQALGVSEVLWSQQIWTTERSNEGWRWMEDMGSATANHYDHVHVTVY